jgi:hypothetical protein
VTDGARESETAWVAALVADARPVRPLWGPGVRLGGWLLVATALVGLYGGLSPRADLRGHLGQPAFVIELATLGALAAWLAWLASRGAFPDRVPTRAEHRGTAALLAAGMATVLVRPPDWDVTLAAFIATGGPCLATTLGLALAPALVLLGAAARGAPLAPRWTGALAGGAGVLTAYVAMRLHCPLDDGLHLLLWHALPIGLTAGLCAAAGARLLGGWLRRGMAAPSVTP